MSSVCFRSNLCAFWRLLTSEAVEAIAILRSRCDQSHLQPKPVVAEQAFMTEMWEFINPLTSNQYRWGQVHRGQTAQAAVRLLKAQLKIIQEQRLPLSGRSHAQTTCQGRCNCPEPNFHLRGSNPARCRNTCAADGRQGRGRADSNPGQDKCSKVLVDPKTRRDLAQNLRTGSKPLHVGDVVLVGTQVRDSFRRKQRWLKGRKSFLFLDSISELGSSR